MRHIDPLSIPMHMRQSFYIGAVFEVDFNRQYRNYLIETIRKIEADRDYWRTRATLGLFGITYN